AARSEGTTSDDRGGNGCRGLNRSDLHWHQRGGTWTLANPARVDPGATVEVGSDPITRKRGDRHASASFALLSGSPSPRPPLRFFAASFRKLGPVSSRIVAWCTTRSIAHAVVIGSLKIRSHCENTKLLVIKTLRRS